ncbi:diacylglycerol kinase [Sinisalibacter aestuarii]|uniref:Diacylglycerol kinase n=1 Tax=Sinisalibacter aestuarii TaxID=2949426 RepID=A0ABQ5LQG7_9RHOB|nr:diacylglycerol kinase [Sinisalibacter aestuarii]GKY86883.1 diacylglycerol kinase [Sinisalibacter aestuarii]
MKAARREWRRFVNRCVWSLAGWRDTWAHEPSLRFWTSIVALSTLAALLLPLGFSERAVILPLGLLVLAAELMNTAVERAVDYISTEEHPLARRAKDAGSAAVALTAIAGGVAWGVILWRLAAG